MSRGVGFGASCGLSLGENVTRARIPRYDLRQQANDDLMVQRVVDAWDSSETRIEVDPSPLDPDPVPVAPAVPPSTGRARLEWLIEEDAKIVPPDQFAGFPGMRREPVDDMGGPEGAGLTDYVSRAESPADPADVRARVDAAMESGDVNAGRTPEMIARDEARTEQADRMQEAARATIERRFEEGWMPHWARRTRDAREKVLETPLTPAEIETVRLRYAEEVAAMERDMGLWAARQRGDLATPSPGGVIREMVAGEMLRARFDRMPDSLIAEVKLERVASGPKGRSRRGASLGPDASDPYYGSVTRTKGAPPAEGTGYVGMRRREARRNYERTSKPVRNEESRLINEEVDQIELARREQAAMDAQNPIMTVDEVKAAILREDDAFLYHVGDLDERIIADGLEAGGLQGQSPNGDLGYGNIVYVFRREDLPPNFESSDISLTEGDWEPPRPIAAVDVDELGMQQRVGDRAAENGAFDEPDFDMTPQETAAMQERLAEQRVTIDAAFEAQRGGPVQQYTDTTPYQSRQRPTASPFWDTYSPTREMSEREWELIKQRNMYRSHRNKESQTPILDGTEIVKDTRKNKGTYVARPGQSEFNPNRVLPDPVTGEMRPAPYTPASAGAREDFRWRNTDEMVGDVTPAAEIAGSGPDPVRSRAERRFEEENGRPPIREGDRTYAAEDQDKMASIIKDEQARQRGQEGRGVSDLITQRERYTGSSGRGLGFASEGEIDARPRSAMTGERIAARRAAITDIVMDAFERRVGRGPSTDAEFAMIDRIVEDRMEVTALAALNDDYVPPRRQADTPKPVANLSDESADIDLIDSSTPPGARIVDGPPITSFRGEHAFLSNFHEAPVTIEGITYPTAEHAFQAMKSTDPAVRREIAGLRNAAEAKRRGGSIPLAGRRWSEIREDVMLTILRAKFKDPELAARLKATGSARLVEGNNWGDTFWGMSGGKGKNVLGEILMRIREELA